MTRTRLIAPLSTLALVLAFAAPALARQTDERRSGLHLLTKSWKIDTVNKAACTTRGDQRVRKLVRRGRLTVTHNGASHSWMIEDGVDINQGTVKDRLAKLLAMKDKDAPKAIFVSLRINEGGKPTVKALFPCDSSSGWSVACTFYCGTFVSGPAVCGIDGGANPHEVLAKATAKAWQTLGASVNQTSQACKLECEEPMPARPAHGAPTRHGESPGGCYQPQKPLPAGSGGHGIAAGDGGCVGPRNPPLPKTKPAPKTKTPALNCAPERPVRKCGTVVRKKPMPQMCCGTESGSGSGGPLGPLSGTPAWAVVTAAGVLLLALVGATKIIGA